MEPITATQKAAWEREQEAMSARVWCPEEGGYSPRDGDVLLAFDIQYDGDLAHVAGDLSRWRGEHLATCTGAYQVTAPYLWGFFCFREGPPLLAMLQAMKKEGLPHPSLLLVDGHGLAHPRRFGAACWVGVHADLPTLGCAKDTLLPYEGALQEARGSVVAVRHKGDLVGHVLRRIDGIRPVYVSAGHKLSLTTATEIVLELPSGFRIPDPLRRADHAARRRCKGIIEPDMKELGMLPPIAPGE